MVFYGLRLEYTLEGSLNYISWKDRMEVVLEDNGLKEYIDNDIQKPPTFNAEDLEEQKKIVEKATMIVLEGVQDHIVSNLHGKENPCEMWQALTKSFQNSSDHKKLAVKDNIQNIMMQKGDTIPQYISRFTECHDELGQVGFIVAEDDLVNLTLPGLPKSWHNYQDLVNERENLPNWELLQSNLVQKEIKQNIRDTTSSKCDDEDHCALSRKAKKRKGKK